MLILNPDSADWALCHVLARGDTDLFPVPFEYQAIQHDWDRLKGLLLKDLDGWAVRPMRQSLTPKREFGLRPSTQLDPLDTLAYLALIYEAGTAFEAVRVPTSEGRVFSYRFKPDSTGQLYDPSHTYESFRQKSLELASDATFVVMTDIADFFPRLYAHPVENAMKAALPGSDHPRVLSKLISSWNMGVSYGIPIGPASSRLISEVAIADVDQALLSEGIEFCRFSDDYRLFFRTRRHASEGLAFLANVLHRNHGLTLSEAKTEVIPAEQFQMRFERAERDEERHQLQASFEELAQALDIETYGSIDYEDLNEDQQAMVDSLNLWVLVSNGASSERSLDIPLLRFALARIAQLGLRDDSNVLLENVERFAPVLRELVEALVAQADLSELERERLGGLLLSLIDLDTVGHLPYHREWLLFPFASSSMWDQRDALIRLYDRFFDEITRRAITVALGRACASHWFKTRKPELWQLSLWNRRAFLYGASCLPGDEAKHWYRSVEPQLDPLDKAVVRFAREHPIA